MSTRSYPARSENVTREAFSIGGVGAVFGVSRGLIRLEIGRRKLRARRVGHRVIVTRRALRKYLGEGPAGDRR